MEGQAPDWLDVSRETLEKLDHYVAEVLRWNRAINLISKSSVADVWQRHVLDSAQLFHFGDAQNKWVDLGSGGGFPGIVLAIMGAPQMILIESDQRKATFLREICRQLSLSATVLAKRIDDTESLCGQTVSARALAPLTELLGHATHHLASGGRAIFPKGRNYQQELADAQINWAFEAVITPSRTDPDAAILTLENIRRRQT